MAKLYFKYGAMGSSKTAQALITKYNYEENDLNVWLIKPALTPGTARRFAQPHRSGIPGGRHRPRHGHLPAVSGHAGGQVRRHYRG